MAGICGRGQVKMWVKFKHWLTTADEYEGLTGFDAICMFVWNLLAWAIPLTLIMLERKGII